MAAAPTVGGKVSLRLRSHSLEAAEKEVTDMENNRTPKYTHVRGGINLLPVVWSFTLVTGQVLWMTPQNVDFDKQKVTGKDTSLLFVIRKPNNNQSQAQDPLTPWLSRERHTPAKYPMYQCYSPNSKPRTLSPNGGWHWSYPIDYEPKHLQIYLAPSAPTIRSTFFCL
jgi:hypothetical protein